MAKLRVAIIGAGPCGLAQLLAFKQEQRVEVVCFERQADWGGLWLYTSRIGVDAHGEPIHSSMYRDLWSNNPKEVFEFADYSFSDHYGCSLPSYLPRAVIYDYLIGRARGNDLRRFIRFNTAVRHVQFNKTNEEFSVDIEDLNARSTECLQFDRVVVATGHYHVPNMIDVDGVNQFPGRVLHSHEFRGADEFIGLNLLIIGGSFSAEDIALQCYKFGAGSMIISSSQPPPGYKWPSEIRHAPMVTRMEGRTAHFEDGSSSERIDAIIFCTGYRHSYPFMDEQLRLEAGVTEFVPKNLYKSIFWTDEPRVAYLGAPRQLLSFPIFDGQAALVRDVFLDRIRLPDKDQCQADMDEWRQREKSLSSDDFGGMIDLQTDYMDDIYALLRTYEQNRSSCSVDFARHNQMSKAVLQSKLDDVIRYRDRCFESIVNLQNDQVVEVHKPWIENMDDSMENFLTIYRKK